MIGDDSVAEPGTHAGQRQFDPIVRMLDDGSVMPTAVPTIVGSLVGNIVNSRLIDHHDRLDDTWMPVLRLGQRQQCQTSQMILAGHRI